MFLHELALHRNWLGSLRMRCFPELFLIYFAPLTTGRPQVSSRTCSIGYVPSALYGGCPLEPARPVSLPVCPCIFTVWCLLCILLWVSAGGGVAGLTSVAYMARNAGNELQTAALCSCEPPDRVPRPPRPLTKPHFLSNPAPSRIIESLLPCRRGGGHHGAMLTAPAH